MKFAKQIMKFTKTKRSHQLLAIVIVLVVIAVGLILITSHASTPFGQVTASSGNLGGNASVASNGSATNGHYVQFNTPTSTGGPPALPTGAQTVNGITFNSLYTSNFNGSSPPSNTYWFQSSSPGAGDNAIWPGNLAVLTNGQIAITTEIQSGKVASGGIGAGSGIAQSPPAMVDWTEKFGGDVSGLVRYMLWWPSGGNWPQNQEFDMLEGNPSSPTQFHMTWHGNDPKNSSKTNITVGHFAENNVDNVKQWYAFRSIWVAGSSGYMELLAGPDFNNLSEVSEVTAAQLALPSTNCQNNPGGVCGADGAVFDTTPHVADWAVEAEGPVNSSLLPVVDNIGGFQLYK
jgi:hypothetical protein